jgi:hypothetical protein
VDFAKGINQEYIFHIPSPYREPLSLPEPTPSAPYIPPSTPETPDMSIPSPQPPAPTDEQPSDDLATVIIHIPTYEPSWADVPMGGAAPDAMVELCIRKTTFPYSVESLADKGVVFYREAPGRLATYKVLYDFGELGVTARVRQGDQIRVAVPPGEYSFLFGVISRNGGTMYGVVPTVTQDISGHCEVHPR